MSGIVEPVKLKISSFSYISSICLIQWSLQHIE